MCERESGIQVLNRNTGKSRPSIVDLNRGTILNTNFLFFPHQNKFSSFFPDLFEDGLQPGVVEISGEENSGKSFLAYQLIVRALLPARYGGSEGNVFFLDTENKFKLNNLLYFFKRYIEDLEGTETMDQMEICLKNLHVMKCFNYDQFELALEKLPDLLASNGLISLVMIDSIASFYWSESDSKSTTFENYLKSCNQSFAKLCEEHQISIFYTRPSHFKPSKDSNTKYKIELEKIDGKAYKAKISYNQREICKIFRIMSTGVHFVKSPLDEQLLDEWEGEFYLTIMLKSSLLE